MQQQEHQDLEAKIKKPNLRFGTSGLCSLITMFFLSTNGCANDEVQITGKVTKVESHFVSTDVHKDEKTGKLTSYSNSACTIYIYSGGVEYKLSVYDGRNQGLCNQIIEESAGVQCCEEFRREYEREELSGASKSDKKERTNAAVGYEKCRSIKCSYPYYNYVSNYSYTAHIDNDSKSPTITVITNPKEIRDRKDSEGNNMKQVYVDRDSVRYNSNPSQVSVQPSPYVMMNKVMDSVLHSFKRVVLK
ncbi:hypothetical protein HY636_03715 [Candidatus Woesearchaeota archaeon]|nr:hypothetical protein [Candidatus Woesearchaeota archaeon]